MKLYDLKLTLVSALGTPLAADTIFGHICWGIRYYKGVAALKEFLNSFEAGKPPLVISDPFPDGFWPIPLLPKPTPAQEKKLLDLIRKQSRSKLRDRLPGCPFEQQPKTNEITMVEAFDVLKWLGKLRWVKAKTLEQLINEISTYRILDYFTKNGCGQLNMPKEAMVAHNIINRLTNTVLTSGGLFFTKDLYVSLKEPVRFHILIATDAYTQNDIVGLFEDALCCGYGRDKSTGKGKIKVGEIIPFEMPKVENPNAVLLLGPCAPKEDDPADGYWQVFTRYGKLGGDWATGPGPTGEHNPFKKPLTMLKAGSVLFTDSPNLYYGRLIDNVHPDFTEVRHYGLALAMPIHCDLQELK